MVKKKEQQRPLKRLKNGKFVLTLRADNVEDLTKKVHSFALALFYAKIILTIVKKK